MTNITPATATPANEKAKRGDWTRTDWASEVADLKGEIDDIRFRIDELQDELDTLESELEHAEEELEQAEEGLANAKPDLWSVEAIAQHCLAEAGNNHARAIALAGKHARGARLRMVVMAIGKMRVRVAAQ